ncbi:MAG: hypothetical protein ACLPQY_23935 [Streptosporangiaceae bacterium]
MSSDNRSRSSLNRWVVRRHPRGASVGTDEIVLRWPKRNSGVAAGEPLGDTEDSLAAGPDLGQPDPARMRGLDYVPEDPAPAGGADRGAAPALAQP